MHRIHFKCHLCYKMHYQIDILSELKIASMEILWCDWLRKWNAYEYCKQNTNWVIWNTDTCLMVNIRNDTESALVEYIFSNQLSVRILKVHIPFHTSMTHSQSTFSSHFKGTHSVSHQYDTFHRCMACFIGLWPVSNVQELFIDAQLVQRCMHSFLTRHQHLTWFWLSVLWVFLVIYIILMLSVVIIFVETSTKKTLSQT